MGRARVLVGAALLLATAAACKGKPQNAADWAERVQGARKMEDRLEAIRQLRRLKDKVAVPSLVKALEDQKLREECAFTLGEIGDPAAVQPLIDAIDYSAAGGDEAARMSIKANMKIAAALGMLGDKKAVGPLIKLLKNRDGFTRAEAIKALGALNDKAAVGPLSELAADDREETFINKTAIIALGNLGDPAGLPAITKMLFRERRGISFFVESSFSAFQIGKEAVDPLLKVLEGKDKELEQWASEHDVQRAALYVKAANLLGDLGDARAVQPLIAKLKYTDDLLDMQLLVRNFAASSLGRLYAPEGAAPIAGLLEEEEANVRQSYCSSLVLIGDRAVVPKMLAAAKIGSWDARSVTMVAVTQLGDERESAALDALVKTEKDKGMPACLENSEEEKEAAQKSCETLIGGRQTFIKDQMARLDAARECKKDGACWTGKLKDANWHVRERAAFELGRLGDAKALPPLIGALSEEQLEVRYAAVTSVERLAPKDPPTAKAAVPNLLAQLEKERGKAHYVKVNEDVRRLQIKLQRL